MTTIRTLIAGSALAVGLFAPLASAQDFEIRSRAAIEPQRTRAASGLSREILPRDTAFVVHVDIQGLLGSVWWKTFEEATGLMDEIADDDDFDRMRKEFGVDPFKDLLSVTVIGHDEDGDDAVVVLRTTDRIDKALDMVRAMDGYRTVAHDGLELESFSEGDDGAFGLVLSRKGSDQRRVVIGQDKGRVAKVVRTMLGEATSLAEVDDAPLRAKPARGSYFYLEVGLPLADLFDDTPASQIASRAKRLTIDVGERSDSVVLAAAVEAGNSDDARQIADVVNGAKSILALSGVLEEAPYALAEAVEDLRAERDGNTVRLSLSMAISEVRESLSEMQERYR